MKTWIVSGSGRLVKETEAAKADLKALVERWNKEAEDELIEGYIDWDYPYSLEDIEDNEE